MPVVTGMLFLRQKLVILVLQNRGSIRWQLLDRFSGGLKGTIILYEAGCAVIAVIQ